MTAMTVTYDHILLNTRDPVRSPIYKQQRAELVLGSVTTWESSVLYVLCFAPALSLFASSCQASSAAVNSSREQFETLPSFWLLFDTDIGAVKVGLQD